MSWEQFGARRRGWDRHPGPATTVLLIGAATLAIPVFFGDGLPAIWWIPLVAILVIAAALGLSRVRRPEPTATTRPAIPSVLVLLDRLLQAAWWIGLLTVVGAVGAGLFGPRTFVEGPGGGLTIGVRFDDPSDLRVEAPGNITYRTDAAVGSVTIADPDGRALAAVIAIGGLALGAALLIVHQLRGVVRSAVRGDPFAAPNARRLRVVGGVTILTGIAWSPLSNFVVSQTVERVDHGGPAILGAPASTMFVLCIPGLVLLALAEVFRWGRGLQDDQALTI